MGKSIKPAWKLAVSSVSEAIHAINVLTHDKLNKYLYEHGTDKFHVVVNGRKLSRNGEWDLKDPNLLEKIKESEFNLRINKLETIDIIPVIEFAGSDALTVLLGALLIVVGVLIAVGTLGGGAPLAAALIIGGIGVIAAGVINLLSKPPASDDFREIQSGGKSSYLFSGPQNLINEGGPVPVGYGNLVVGSQVISASYKVSNIPITANEGSLPTPNGLLFAVNMVGGAYAYFESDKDNLKFAYMLSTASLVDHSETPGTITNTWKHSASSQIYKSSKQSSNTDACHTQITLGAAFANRDIMVRAHFVNYFQPTKTFRVYMGGVTTAVLDANLASYRISDHLGNNIFDLDSYGVPQAGSYVIEKRYNLSTNGELAVSVNRDAGSGSFALCAIEIYDYSAVALENDGSNDITGN